MKIVMTLLVRNEEDIVAANLDFHFSKGVDFVIATDNGSVDRTRHILQRYADEGRLHVIDEPADDYAQSEWVTRMARMAATEFSADWIVHADADEFWWSETGSLREYLANVTEDTIAAHRYNFVPVPEPDERPIFERMTVREVVSLGPNGNRIGPKTCHRATSDVEVSQGNHDVRSGSLKTRRVADDLLIFHFPMRTFKQFETKIQYGGSALNRNTKLPPDSGYHWRAYYQRYLDGTLESAYLEYVFDAARIRSSIQSGSVVEDFRLRDAMSLIQTSSRD